VLPRIRIGVSACLLGAKVRFDGRDKRDAFLVDELGPLCEWVSVCPEVEVGMGVPREAVRLVADRDRGAGPRMLGVETGADWTARMNRFAASRVRALAREQLSGFVLKSKSPSCGMERVKLFADVDARNPLRARSAGLFAATLARAFPNLPIEDEERLQDRPLRESFIARVFAYARLRALFGGRWTLGALAAFHAAHETALRAHSTDGARALGRLVARGKSLGRAQLRARYEAGFMATLARPATPGRQRHRAGLATTTRPSRLSVLQRPG